MKHHSTKNIAVAGIAVFALALSSCSNMDDSTLTLAQGTSIGALGGAAVGAGIGALVSKDSAQGALVGGGIGMVTGALVGNMWGASIVKKKSEYASQEAYLNANIKQLKSRISDVKKTNNTLEKEIAALQSSKKADKNRIATIRKNVAARASLINKDISTANSALRSGSASNSAELRAQVAQLTQQRNTMESRMATLSALARKV